MFLHIIPVYFVVYQYYLFKETLMPLPSLPHHCTSEKGREDPLIPNTYILSVYTEHHKHPKPQGWGPEGH